MSQVKAAGLEIYQDIHADRSHTESGQLIPRSQPGAKQTFTSASAILDLVARNLLAWHVSCGDRARVVQLMLDLMRQARQRAMLRD